MPKISDERRSERRNQILEAARRCFLREGLHMTTMSDIIRESNLSAGAVYSYFKNKEELIQAALATSLSGLSEILKPLFARSPVPSPDRLLGGISSAIADFSKRDGFDLRRLALLGWSESQRNESLRGVMRVYYLEFRNQLAAVSRAWQQAGYLSERADPDDLAKAMLACIMGFVAQSAIIGEITPTALQNGMHAFGTTMNAHAKPKQGRQGPK